MIEERLVGTNPLIETRRESHESVNKQKKIYTNTKHIK